MTGRIDVDDRNNETREPAIHSMSTTPELPTETDVVVIGGGVIGTSIAYFLTTEADREVTLLEKDAIGAGSTGDSSAIIRRHYGEKERYTRLADWSYRFYSRFEEEVGEPIAFERNRRVTFAAEGTETADYAENGREILERLDRPVSRYEGAAMEREFPMFDLEEFDFAVSDDDAAYSDGTDVASGFARAVQDAGGTVVTGVAVEGFDVEDDTVTAVETTDGSVECETAVLAAGPWTPRLAAELDVDVPITPSRERVILLDPSEEYLERHPDVLPTAGLPGGYYARSEFGGGALIATHHSGETCDPDDYRNTPDQETLLELHATLSEYVPGLEDAGVQGRYSGVYSNTPDHDFILDECGPAGCYLACGFSGHGFKHAPAIGRLMTDLIEDGRSELTDLEFFSLSRFADDDGGHGGGIEF
ncbi:NAD(P)/FAD-dependent oxidoreductase [Halopenitus persicus]|nr:FAD-binding oxidoreductase [Halopenitus persicus]